MLGRSGGAARRNVGKRGEIIVAPLGVGYDLVAHQRHAYEIGDALRCDQSHRFFRIPAGHEHEFAASHKAGEKQRHFRSHVEQRQVEQRSGRHGRPPFLGEDTCKGCHRACEAHRRLDLSPVRGNCSLARACRAGGEENGRMGIRPKSRQHLVHPLRAIERR